MKVTFQLEQDDYVKFNEYHSIHSPLHIKARRKHRVIVPIIYLVITVLSLLNSDYVLATVFGIFAILWFLLSPAWQKRRYRKHFQKHVAETIGDALKEPSSVELMEDGIHSTSYAGHSVFKYSVVEKIVENEGFTYIYIGKGMAIIIPHDRVDESEVNELVAEIKKHKATCEPAG